jgi:gamma-glutamyltranspeptidase/glutathione hydrolase
MGGDAQPQIILQVVARMLRSGEDPAAAVAGARVTLEAPAAGPFRLWHGDLVARIEGHAPPAWEAGLRRRGHEVLVLEPLTQAAGCAHAVAAARDEAGLLALAAGADPRSAEAGAVGY